MGALGDWSKKNSKTLILDDGESKEVVYQGYKIGANPFDSEKEIVFYKMEVQQEDGEMSVKAFKSASGKAARFFDALKPGTKVRIKRLGKGSDTKYEFHVIGEDHKEEAGEADEQVEF